jgi:hypothetical protein
VQKRGDDNKQGRQQHQCHGGEHDVRHTLQAAADWPTPKCNAPANINRTRLSALRSDVRARIDPAHASIREKLIAPPG